MKKVFFRMLPVVATGLVLTACNNAEEVKKQVDEQNAKIQSLVDEKLAGLQTEADAACTALVDSLANAQYEAWVAEEGAKKGGKKPVVKPKPTTTKTETTKKEEPKGGLQGKSDQSQQQTGGIKSKSDENQQAQPGGGGLRQKRDGAPK